jgi:hypothetical protein
MTMAAFVYLLCAVTSVICATLLLRNARRSPTRLLFWSGAAFICFALGNIFLFVDLVLVPETDLVLLRQLFTLGGVVLLLYGLIWETE